MRKKRLTESEELWETMVEALRHCDGMDVDKAEAYLRSLLRRAFDIPDFPPEVRGNGLYSWWSV